MKLKLLLVMAFIALLSGMVLAQSEDVVRMEVGLHVTKASIDSTAIDLYAGEPQDYFNDYEEFYNAKVYSVRGELLSNFSFPKSFWVFTDPGGGFEQDEYDTSVSFLYYNNVKRMEVWDGRVKMLDLDLSAYTTCNQDSVCDSSESEMTCAEDCRARKADVTDRVPPAEKPIEVQPESVAKPVAEGSSTMIIIAVVAGILVLLILWLVLRRSIQRK